MRLGRLVGFGQALRMFRILIEEERSLGKSISFLFACWGGFDITQLRRWLKSIIYLRVLGYVAGCRVGYAT